MRNCILSFLAVFLLVGCGSARTERLNSSLDYAYSDARTTLALTDSLAGEEASSDTLVLAWDLLKLTHKRQQSQPDPEQYEGYAEVQEMARAVLERTVLKQMQENQSNLRELREDLSRLTGDRDGSIATLRNRMNSLRNRVEDQRERLETLRSRLRASNEKIARMSSTLEENRRTLGKLRGRLEDARKKLSELRSENKKIADLVEERVGRADVRREHGQVFISFQEKILFDSGQADLTESSQRSLDRLAPVLKKFPDRPVRVYGHTDTSPTSANSRYDSNWSLSGQRAINVLKYLAYGRGVTRERLAAVGFADRRPLVSNASRDSRTRNRRVEVVMLPRDRTIVRADTPGLKDQNSKLLEEFSGPIRDRNLRTDQGSVYVNLTDRLSFPSARAILDEESRSVLDKIGPVLESTARPIRVQGHTDDLPMADGSVYESNWELSMARSISVVEYLIEHYDLDSRELGAVGMGQFHPLETGEDEEVRARNRRVEILMLPRMIESTSLDLLE